MKLLLCLLFSVTASVAVLQTSSSNQTPRVQDLDFLIGTWEIKFDYYETKEPEKGVVFTENGTQECFYELKLNGTPMFLTCRSKVTGSNGRVREYSESLRYSRFEKCFIRAGIFSNWPSISMEKIYFDPALRTLEMRGELDIQDGLLERYQDVYVFDEAFERFTRKNVANFSDMPVVVFNTTITGTGKKVLN